MTNEQETKRILDIMHSGIFLTHSDCAIALVNAGIGDKKQAVKEFAEKLKSVRYDNTWRFARGEVDVDPYGVSDEQINQLFTELYGADNE